MVNKKADIREQVWEHGWEDHDRRQMERLAALPLSEKLVWLEEAHRLVLHVQSKRAKGTEAVVVLIPGNSP